MSPRMLRVWAMASLVALAGACGGDDDSGEPVALDAAGSEQEAGGGSGDASTLEEYIAQADAICADHVAESEAFALEAGEGALNLEEPDPAALQEYLRQQLDMTEQFLAEIRGLTLPDGDVGSQIEAAVGDFEGSLEATREATSRPEAASAFVMAAVFGGEGDTSSGEATALAAAADEELAALGFNSCFSGFE